MTTDNITTTTSTQVSGTDLSDYYTLSTAGDTTGLVTTAVGTWTYNGYSLPDKFQESEPICTDEEWDKFCEEQGLEEVQENWYYGVDSCNGTLTANSYITSNW